MDSSRYEIRTVAGQQRPYKVYDPSGVLIASTRVKEQADVIIAIQSKIAS